MAKTLSSASITDGSAVEAWHVTQSIDAFNSIEAYDITLSGSLTLSDDTTMVGTASYAVTASYAENAGGGGSSDTGSLLTTASVASDTITFTKGDASTFDVVVDNVVNSNSSSLTAALQANGELEGLTTASGHIIPAANDLYDLGNAEYKFRDLYLGSSTLYMSGSGGWMSGSWDGTNFNINNNALVRSAVTSSMTVLNSQKSICNFNVTTDPNNPLTGNLNFAAGGATLASGTIIISAFGAELAGLSLGNDCWVTVTAVSGGGSTGIFDVSLAANGRITITEIGGTSNATVMYQIMYFLP